MNKKKLYIKMDSLVQIVASLLCIISIINSRMVLPFPFFGVIQRYNIRILVVLAFYMICSKPALFRKKTFLFWGIFLSLVGITFISAIINRNTIAGANPIYFARLDFFLMATTFITLLYCVEMNNLESFFRILMWHVVVNCVLTDVFILAGMDFGGNSGGVNYFIGTKFTVSYTHMIMCVLYPVYQKMRHKEVNKIVFCMMALLTIAITIIVGCNTGTIGTVILLSLMLLKSKICNLVYTRFVYLGTMFLGTIFVMTYSIVLSLPIIQNFIQNTLKRDLSLTGRTDIYERLFWVIMQKPLFGYGYGLNGRVSKLYFQYANTQNGIMEWIIQIGFLGIIPLIFLFLYTINKVIKVDSRKDIYSMVIMVIVYNCLATVEVTISLTYIFFIFLIYIWCYRKDINKEKGIVD